MAVVLAVLATSQTGVASPATTERLLAAPVAQGPHYRRVDLIKHNLGTQAGAIAHGLTQSTGAGRGCSTDGEAVFGARRCPSAPREPLAPPQPSDIQPADGVSLTF
ncbi:MAG: hypothetical protein AAFR93_05370 [Pseudomonadota bacterium]